MRSGGEINLTKDLAIGALFGEGWKSASGSGGGLTGTPTSPGGAKVDPFTAEVQKQTASLNRMDSNNNTAAIGQGVATAAKAIGDTTTAIINHCAKMSALRHQNKMQNKAWAATVQAIKDEGSLVDDIKTISTTKIERAGVFVQAKKDLTIAEARYLEAQKTDKAMKKTNKTLVKKALSDRRSKFYGKTA